MKYLRNNTRRLLKLLALFMCVLIFSSCTNCVSCSFEDLFNVVVMEPTEKDTERDINQISHETQKQTELPTEELIYEPPVPIEDLDCEGFQIKVLLPADEMSIMGWTGEDEYWESISAAVIYRNEEVFDDINASIDFDYIVRNDNYSSVYLSYMIDDVIGGYHKYDVAVADAEILSSATIRGATANLANENIFPYFDFSQPCWIQSSVESQSINGKLYSVTSEINYDVFSNMAVLWANVGILRNIVSNGIEPLVSTINDGKWTYDELYRKLSVFDMGDGSTAYGLGIDRDITSELIDSIPYVWDINFVSEDKKSPTFLFDSNSKADDAILKLKSIFGSKGTDTYGSMTKFADDEYVFFFSKLAQGYDEIETRRRMESAYMLCPLPKYDVGQSDYLTYSEGATLIAVLDHNQSKVSTHGGYVSAMLQLLAEKSYSTYRGYYFNRIIKGRYFGTDDSDSTSPMYNSIAFYYMLVSNIRFDLLSLYPGALAQADRIWSNAYNSGKTVAEVYTEKKEAYENEIKALLRCFE